MARAAESPYDPPMGSFGLRRFAFVALGAALVVSCGLLVDTSGLSDGAEPGDDGATSGDGGIGTDATGDVAQTGDGNTGVDAKADAAPLAYREVVLSDGPIAYYRLAETSGSVANDETGNHDGTYALTGSIDYNQPGPAAGVPSVRFKDVAHVSANSVAMLPVGTFASYTLEAFVALEVLGTSTFFLNFAASGGGGAPSLWVDDTTQKFRYSFPNIDSTVVIGLTWHHLAVTASGTTISIYVDGAFDTSGTDGAPSPDRGRFTIGSTFSAGVDGGAGYYNPAFKGRLAEVAVYGKALSPARIAAHYAARP